MTKFKIVRCQSWRDPWSSFDCNKVAFDYKCDAEEYANYLLQKRGWKMRVYWDEDCRCYHLTKDIYGRGW